LGKELENKKDDPEKKSTRSRKVAEKTEQQDLDLVVWLVFFASLRLGASALNSEGS
jgi:hypothetical protein